MDTNTIIILTAVLTFIFVFVMFFIMLMQKGRKNAKKGYVFTHWFNGCKPYINQDVFFANTCALIDRAENDDIEVIGIEVRLITESNDI